MTKITARRNKPAMDREQRGEQRKRLNEIVEVLRRNEIVRG